MRVYFLLRTIRARRTKRPLRAGPSPERPFTVEGTFAGETDNSVTRPVRRIRQLELSDDNDVNDAGIAQFIAEFIDEFKSDYSQLTYSKLRTLNRQGRLM